MQDPIGLCVYAGPSWSNFQKKYFYKKQEAKIHEGGPTSLGMGQSVPEAK
jgi:hypothetical protein